MTKLLHALVLLAATASPAFAQAAAPTRAYISGSVFGDIKRFSGDVDEPVLNGQGIGGGVAVGTSVHPRWDVQLGVEVPTFTSTSRDRSVTFQKNIITMRSIAESQTLSVSTLVRFHGAAHRRVQLGYLGGISLVRFRRDNHTEAPSSTPSSLIPRPQSTVGYAAGPTLGIDARVLMSSHLSFVPGVHATVFSLSDSLSATSGITIRPRVAIRWSF